MAIDSLKKYMLIWWILCGLSSTISHATNKDISLVFQNANSKDKKDMVYDAVTKTPSSDIHYHDAEDFSKKGLDGLAFDDTLGINFLKERISFNTFIKPMIVSREEFNGYKGDFLVKSDSMNAYGQEEYTLYLPDSMKISELPAIIKKVNTMTYGDILPETASTMEIKHQIEYTIRYLVSIKNDKNKEEVQKAISRYYQLFEQYFPGEKPNISISRKSIDQHYFDALQQASDDEELMESMESVLAESLYEHFLESFFEMWSKMVGNIGDIKTMIGIDDLKQQLATAKKSGNKTLIAKAEKEVISKICKTLNIFYEKNKYNGYRTDFEQSQPSEIIKTNMANCVWLAIIGHQLLDELGIDYNARIMFNHIALSVNLSDGTEYLLDPKTYEDVQEMKIVKKKNNSEEISVAQDTMFTIKGDKERFLMTAIIVNETKIPAMMPDIKKKIRYLEQSIDLNNEKNSIFLYLLADAYLMDKQAYKALEAINRAIELDADKRQYRYKKNSILIDLWIFDERFTETQTMMKKYQ